MSRESEFFNNDINLIKMNRIVRLYNFIKRSHPEKELTIESTEKGLKIKYTVEVYSNFYRQKISKSRSVRVIINENEYTIPFLDKTHKYKRFGNAVKQLNLIIGFYKSFEE